MGADPEAELLNGVGQVVEAGSYISDPDRNKAFGLDGCPNVAELRPNPGTWGSVYLSLRRIIKQADRDGLRLSIAGDTFAVGGHIHFAAQGWTEEITNALDSYVFPLFDKLQGKARGYYLRKGATETKPYGFEYRSLPGAWLATPLLCKLTLKLAYKIAISVIRYNLMATGEPVAPEYNNYRHFMNKRDFVTLLAEIDRVAQNKAYPINGNWGGKTYFSFVFRDDYLNVDVPTRNDLPVPVVFFGLKKERGENLLYCPRLPQLAEVVGAVNYPGDDLHNRFNKDFPLYVGLTPDLRRPDVITKIINYVRDNH